MLFYNILDEDSFYGWVTPLMIYCFCLIQTTASTITQGCIYIHSCFSLVQPHTCTSPPPLPPHMVLFTYITLTQSHTRMTTPSPYSLHMAIFTYITASETCNLLWAHDRHLLAILYNWLVPDTICFKNTHCKAEWNVLLEIY